ncbi:thioesterase II family protein [Streptomyces yunnanensis]|uniref:Surfactin synthase thioesterase subunit n=1 Tax=Streptomyces yunnanensis TaxID=156453 RepID=A0A9X8N6K8_9ACTN|nr:thioesterase domain-containing protein [Streptomyces yunnanensis]SHN15616.1 Surfactin synthase thioesterase subunit [Streptomyces yunnanensis]
MGCDTGTVALPRPRPAPAVDPWLRRLRPGPAHPAAGAARVVCFPHAGGGAGTYRPLATAVAARTVGDRPHEVLAIQYPGRNDRIREARVEDLRALAAGAHRAVAALADRPLVLLGHSMGALVAYEVARLLERDGTGPAHLVVSGAWAPSRVRGGTVHLRDDDGLIDEIRRTRGTDPRLLDNRDVLAMALPVVRSDYKAVETYRHRPGPALATPVTALTGDRDPLVTVEEAAAWAEHTAGGFRLRVFPGGDHFYLTGHWPEVADHLVTAPPRPSGRCEVLWPAGAGLLA